MLDKIIQNESTIIVKYIIKSIETHRSPNHYCIFHELILLFTACITFNQKKGHNKM